MSTTPNSTDFFYFAEQTSAIDPKKFDFTTRRRADAWWLEFVAAMHFFEVLNRNNRGYLKDNVQQMLFSPKNTDLMQRNCWYGEEDHPFSMYKDVELSRKRVEKVYWRNRTHMQKNPVFYDDHLDMTVATCCSTDPGRGLAEDIIQGMIPNFSCRCCGQMEIIKAMPIVLISKLITYDFVPFAGFENASMKGNPKLQSSVITESAEEIHGSPLNHDVCIPVKSLLDDLCKGDDKVYYYMEAADGDLCLEGLSTDEKLMISQGGLHIYAGINKHSVDMVKDFYRSFKL